MAQNKPNNQELKNMIWDALLSRGVVSDLRAKLRAEVYHAIEDKVGRRRKMSNDGGL